MVAVASVLLLLAGQGVELPPQRAGAVTARATVRIPEEGAGPRRARAILKIEIEGPPSLAVESTRLEDALAAWRISWQLSAWSGPDPTLIYLTLGLDQVKPGALPLPGVRLRVREGADLTAREFVWLDLLAETRDVLPILPVPPIPPSPWPERGRWLALGLLSGLIALFLGRACYRARSRTPQLSRWEAARRQLEQPDISLTEIAAILREVVSAQLHLPSIYSTTEELYAAMSQVNAAADTAERLRRLLHQGDLEKFAGQQIEGDELTQARQEALALLEILATWPAGENSAIGEER